MLSFFKRLAGQVPTPKPDHVTLFVDDTGMPAYKDEADVVHDLRGGQGDKGDTGDKGDPGLSAYQVWLAAGNVGTEADYLASLKGAKGDTGDTGAGVPTGGATDSILAKSAAGNFLTKWIAKATTALAQSGTDNSSWMTPSLVSAEILALTGFGASPTTAAITDANLVVGSGIGRTTSATLNLPAGMDTGGVLWYGRTAANETLQIWSTMREVSATNRPALFVRGFYGSQGWGPWRRMADDEMVAHKSGNESIAGLKTFTDNFAIRSRATSAGFWLESIAADTTYGFMINTDGDRLTFNLRQLEFGSQISSLFQMSAASFRFGAPLVPFSANTQSIGTPAIPFNRAYLSELTIGGTAAQKLASRRTLDLPITVSSAAPTAPQAGDIWVDIS